MKKNGIVNVTLFLTALLGSALAFANGDAGTANKVVDVVPVSFDTLDKDKNGLISRDEAVVSGQEKLQKHFELLDLDKDGSLNKEEFNAAI